MPPLTNPSSVSEPFPSFGDAPQSIPPSSQKNLQQREDSSFELAGRLRSASKTFQESNPPSGAWNAAASLVSSAPSISNIRTGAYGTEGWSAQGQLQEREQRSSLRNGATGDAHQLDTLSFVADEGAVPPEQVVRVPVTEHRTSIDSMITPNISTSISKAKPEAICRTTPFDNGYEFPPQRTWQQSTVIGLKAFWKFTCTWFGFLVVVYGLNVVAWGGMIFLLLCNAAPAMCTPSCNDINSPRRIWIEIDAQVLTALFCVTGFGLIPWRFRDLWYLMKYRIFKDELGLRRLAGFNNGWFRLEGSQELPVDLGPNTIEAESLTYCQHSLPFPLKSIPPAPLTGIRAPATALWKLDFVIWMNVWNTFLQAVLSGIMWGMNRYNRPSWATGLFVALACSVAGFAGVMSFMEGKKVKGIEGVPVSQEDLEKLKEDREAGIIHFNNISGKPPKEKENKNRRKHFFERKLGHKVNDRLQV